MTGVWLYDKTAAGEIGLHFSVKCILKQGFEKAILLLEFELWELLKRSKFYTSTVVEE